MSIRIDRLTGTIGAEIRGIDLSGVLDPETVRIIAAAWAQHAVLVFPGQVIADRHQVTFSRHFGRLAVFRQNQNGAAHPSERPEIFRATNTDRNGNVVSSDSEQARLIKLNWLWHIDTSYQSIPSKGVVLHGWDVVEDGGGDTIFADLAAAYEALPMPIRRRIIGLVARHSFRYLAMKSERHRPAFDALADLPPVEHPLVRQHTDGRRSLFLSPPYMERIVGWNGPASHALIGMLTVWACQDRFLYRHRWRRHDVLMWDNGRTMHKVTPYDVGGDRRVMHGVVILGTESIRPATPLI
jgi:alpha-ketoglutarate-dependent taurine dioxygenase